MATIFISYNREDEDKTKALVNDIEELGHTVWFDHELSGGQKWWDTILESIRNCDILVFALSNESLNSSACSLEYDYASKLGKTILPVLVGEGVSINLLPPELSQIQLVDYQEPDRDALLHLAKALTSAPPSQPLPDPLPLPPEVPISYLGKLGKQIRNTSKLSYEEQSTLLLDLKKGLHDPETAADTRTLLKKLRKRQYLFANIAGEIDELLGNTMQTTMTTPHAPKTEHTTLKQSQKQEIGSREVQKKKPFWTSLRGIITGLAVSITMVTGLYFIYEYIIASDYNGAKEEHSDKAITFLNKGIALYDSKRYVEAIAAYDKAIAIDPEYAPNFYNKGLALYQLKRYDGAIVAYNKAIVINPNEIDHFMHVGVALYDSKRYDEAIAAYDKAIAIDPEYAPNFYNKGLALYKLKRYDKAIVAYDKANAIDPDYANAFYNKGLTLYKLKRYDEAIAAYDKTIAIDPDSADAFYGKAYVYALENNKEELLSSLKKLFEIKSSNKHKEWTKTDGAFKKYWNDKDFKKLVEESDIVTR